MKELDLQLKLAPENNDFPSYTLSIQGEIENDKFFLNLDCLLDEKSSKNGINFILGEGCVDGKIENGNLKCKVHFTSGIKCSMEGHVSGFDINLKIKSQGYNYNLIGTIEPLSLELLTQSTNYNIEVIN